MKYLLALLAIVIPLTCVACVSMYPVDHERGSLITAEQTTWIEKGVTSRKEVEQRFGYPSYVGLAFLSGIQIESTTQTRTRKTQEKSTETSESKSETTVGFAKKPTIAKWTHAKTEGTIRNLRTIQQTFFVIYDEEGVVQDIGFEGRSY